MKLFAGFDGGGTKTACVLTDETGRLLGTGTGGPSNYLYCGKEMAAQSVRDGLRMAFEAAGMEPRPLAAAFMASAAILHQHGESHVPFFQSCMDAETVECDGDIIPLWFGAARSGPCIVSIAGTGAITYICREDSSVRVGGWGPLLGDEGSGYDLGLQSLRLACRMADGREKADPEFQDTLLRHFEVTTPGQLLRVLNQGDIRSKVASAAQPVFGLYQQGNGAAKRMLQRCADEIALAILTALREDPSEDKLPLVLSGGLVHPDRPLFGMVEQKLRESTGRIGEISFPKVTPAVSAAALALYRQGYRDSAEALLKGGESL